MTNAIPGSYKCMNGTTCNFEVNNRKVLSLQQVNHNEFTSYFLSFDWSNRLILRHLSESGTERAQRTPDFGMNFHMGIWKTK